MTGAMHNKARALQAGAGTPAREHCPPPVQTQPGRKPNKEKIQKMIKRRPEGSSTWLDGLHTASVGKPLGMRVGRWGGCRALLLLLLLLQALPLLRRLKPRVGGREGSPHVLVQERRVQARLLVRSELHLSGLRRVQPRRACRPTARRLQELSRHLLQKRRIGHGAPLTKPLLEGVQSRTGPNINRVRPGQPL